MCPVIVDLGSTTEARVRVHGQQDARKLQDLAEERCSIVYRAPELFSVESYCMIDERTDIWVRSVDFSKISISNHQFIFTHRVLVVYCMQYVSTKIHLMVHMKKVTVLR